MAARKGWAREEITTLLRFIDWLLTIPEELDRKIQQALNKEEEEAMSYVTSWERIWHADGKLEGKIEGKLEGKREGKQEGLLEGKIDILKKLLSRRPDLGKKYGSMVASATSESDVDQLESRIMNEL